MKKVALVLSGGGFRGAFQAGALEIIRENWNLISPDTPPLRFNIVSGVSVGALNGLLIAQNRPEELMQVWNDIGKNGVGEIYRSDFIDTNFDQGTDNPKLTFQLKWETIKKHFPKTTKNLILKAIFNKAAIFDSFEKEFRHFKAIADNTPLWLKLQKYARIELLPGCVFKCGFVSLNTGSFYSINACDFKTDLDFAKGILASSAMPIIWPPVDTLATNGIEYHQCVDGGIRNVSPLKDVIDEIKNDPSADEYTIIIINCSSGQIQEEAYETKNIAQIALRALSDIAITEIFNNDIREFITKNFLVKQVKEKHPQEVLYDYDFERQQPGKTLKYFNAIIIQPDPNILGDTLTANARQINIRIEHGREKARLALEKHSQSHGDHKTTIT